MPKPFDVAIIGGGINGCGCAADAAMRGLSVVLCEKNDLASETSSSSTKLIHGGLRYLEHYQFSLIRKALKERQTLLEVAPYLVSPLLFVMPFNKHFRPFWMMRFGLFIYEHLSLQNKLPKGHVIQRQHHLNYFAPLSESFKKGIIYYDCRTDDARLTIANALQAKNFGADILTRSEVIKAKVINNLWHITLQSKDLKPRVIRAKSVINAAGPWVESVNQILNIKNQYPLSLVKGSHLVVKKLYEGDHAYVLQHSDNRLIFTIPYYGYTLIGTTEIPFNDTRDEIAITTSETDYLLNLVGTYFEQYLSHHDIITSWSGVRPLLYEPKTNDSKLSRDFRYYFSQQPAPCITIYGGKITTYRILAENVVNQLRNIFPDIPPSLTPITPLPGGSTNSTSFKKYQQKVRQLYPWLDVDILTHYLNTYGTLTDNILSGAHEMNDLGLHFSSTLYQREVDYLIKEEWATTIEDILWRRTKFGLTINEVEREELAYYIQ